ncbi:DMT family transporter [Arhodomonas sp. AD133]|uniref:DMT family transporter n=1 Tax=Arhodomonas sp. AD133 TaxID=3415009 RepID=UPI003EBC0C9D
MSTQHVANTPASRRGLDGRATGLMTLFCVALGLQQVAIKAVAGDVPPLVQIALRSAIAAILVWALAHSRGQAIFERSRLGPGALVGLGFTFEFVFVALGLNYTLASHMVVFLYTAPVFAALGLHFLVPGEQLAPRHWIAVALAFAGMVIAIAPNSTDDDNALYIVAGDALGVLAGISWAATTLAVRTTRLSEAPALQTLFYQLLTAAALLLPITWLVGDLGAARATPEAIASLGFQTLIVSFAALLLWFALLRRYLASRLGILSFLSPLFGVAFGALLLGEPISLNFMVGGAAILAGIVWINL